MPYTVKLSEDLTYVMVTVNGRIDTTEVMEFSLEAHKLARQEGIQLLFIDLFNSRNIQSEHENYELICTDLDGNPGVDRRVKVAIYVAPEDHSHDFGQSVARSDGYNVRLFRDRGEAIFFLTS